MPARITALACISTAIAPFVFAAPAVAAGKKPSVAEIRVVEFFAPPDGSEPTVVIDPLKKGDRITVVPYATSDDLEDTGMQP